MRNRTAGFTLTELMVVISVIAILAALLLPSMRHAVAQGQLSSCKSNLKNLAAAMEMYAQDNGGRYAGGIMGLVPGYMRAIPTCPSAGIVSYQNNFTVASNPDAYTILCSGNVAFHAEIGLGQNYPQYFSSSGLLER